MTVGVAEARPGWPDLGIPGRLSAAVRRRPEIVTAVLCGVVLALGLRGPDLPAQAYRVSLFRHHGLVVFDSHWYAGHAVPGYSLLFPPLAAVIGSRLVGALACVAATAAFTRLLRGVERRGHDVAALWFAVVSVVDLVVGRLPFALGLACGVGALAAARERRTWWMLGLAVATGCASPLAGAFLLLVAAAWLPTAGWRRAWPLAGAGVGLLVAAVLGEGGRFPFPAMTLVAVLAFVAIGLALAPAQSVVIRRGLWLYGATALVAFLVPNPVGGNMVRLGAVVAGPLAAYELGRRGRPVALAVVSVPLLAWQFAPVPSSLAAGAGNASARAGYYAGLLGYLADHGGDNGRLEVPLTRGRWESDYLATRVALARGWERQADLAHNAVLYDNQLTSAAYHRWLLDTGVRWVALPDVPLDASETGEAALLTGATPSYLRPVWHDSHWRLWQVRGARPLVSGPARLVSMGVSTVRLEARRPGTVVVLVRWTRFWGVTEGVGCVAPTPEGWTQVSLPRPGPVTLSATVGLRTLAGGGGGGSCSDPVTG